MEGDGSSIRWFLYIVLGLLVLLGGLFAAAETAYAYCNKTRFKTRAENNDRSAKRVQFILDHFDNALTTVLIGTNICHIVLSTLATVLAIAIMGEIGSLVATITVTIVVFLFSEILPKNIARANADRLAEFLAVPLKALIYLFKPLALILISPFNWLLNKIVKDEDLDYTEEDLQAIVETIEEEGVLDEDESHLIQSAIEFDDVPVTAVYTPLDKLVAIDANTGREEVINLLLSENRYSRIPVYRDNLENIIGILHVRTCLKELLIRPNISLTSLMSKPYTVSPTTKLDDLLEGFSSKKTHMAVVIHKNKTLGIITMDDVLRELIGDILEPTEEGEKQ